MSFIKNNKNLLISSIIFIVLFLTTLIITSFFEPIWCDQVWTFGFSHNISSGLKIYKDFNVLQTPLYFYIGSIFIRLFGNYFLSLKILDSLLIAGIGLLFYRLIKWKMIFPILLLVILPISSYNLLCVLFLCLIINLLNNKEDSYLVPLLVGLILITKQNIGVLVFIPMFIYSKHKIRDTLIFLVPIFILCIYYLFTGSLFGFIDYTFLGLFEFSGNKTFDYILTIIELLVFIYLIYSFIKSKCKDKELLYIIFIQLALYPIIDLNHFSFAFSFFIYCFIKRCDKFIIRFIFCLSEVILLLLLFCTFYSKAIVIKEKNIFYLNNDGKVSSEIQDIYNHFNGNIDNLYIGSEHSYLLKLYYNKPISYYDYMLSGNMGYYSKDKIYNKIKKHCSKNDCIFLIDDDNGKDNQFYEFNCFVMDNYNKQEELEDGFSVYRNKKTDK